MPVKDFIVFINFFGMFWAGERGWLRGALSAGFQRAEFSARYSEWRNALLLLLSLPCAFRSVSPEF